MTIELTQEIQDAFTFYLNETIDSSFDGKSIRRGNCYPYSVFPKELLLLIFIAGYTSALIRGERT